MKKIIQYTLAFGFLLVGVSCSDSLENRLLTKASGRPGEIILVMDSIQWKGELGEALKNTLRANTPGIPIPEPLFTVRFIEPTLFNSVLKSAKNIIVVATLDSQTKGGLIVRNYVTKEYISSNPDKFMVSQKDVFAKGQDLLYLFADSESNLAEKINKYQEAVRTYFNNAESERLQVSLYKALEKTGITAKLKTDHGFNIRVPNGYRIEANDSSFIWLRSPGEIDKNIFIGYKPYTSDEVFQNDQLIALRNSITHEGIFEDPANPDSYMTTDTINMKPIYKTTELNGNYAKNVKGIWRTSNLALGGSFESYVLVDEHLNRLYYIEGFVASPGKNKRETMRELNVILGTFKTSEEKVLVEN